MRVEHHDPGAAPARGPVDAPVIVELFFVPQPGAQTNRLNAYKALENLQAKHPTRVRLIWRVMRQGMLSTAALEAHAQGKFFEFLEKVSTERLAVSKERLFEICTSIGIDADRVAAAISQDRYATTFNDNDRRSRRLHLQTSPAAVFNSQGARFSIQNTVKVDEIDRAYTEAYDRAVELMDQGIPASELGAAYDAKILANVPTSVMPPADDDSDSHDQMLVSPPLPLAGLPTVGDDSTTVPIIFLCSPAAVGSSGCQRTIERAVSLQKDVYPELRLVWAPWFDVGRDDAVKLSLLGDAAICAEQLGTGSPPKSAGWLWTEAMYRQLASSRKDLDPEKKIDAVAKELDVDSRRLSECRAALAANRKTFKWIEAARQSGVRVSPSIIVGGRIYAALSDPTQLQGLIEAELAPGISDTLHEHLGRWPR